MGHVKIGGFSLGTVVGTLFAGVLIGQLDIKLPALVKTVFFDLFLFTTGYKVGPQFFRGLKRDALSQMALTLVLCVTCLITPYAAAKLFGYDTGTAAFVSLVLPGRLDIQHAAFIAIGRHFYCASWPSDSIGGARRWSGKSKDSWSRNTRR